MQTKQDLPMIATDDFARRFSMRGGNLMWFLGAGASAAANIPTAWEYLCLKLIQSVGTAFEADLDIDVKNR